MLDQQPQLIAPLGPEAGLPQVLAQTDGSRVPLDENSPNAADNPRQKRLICSEAPLSLAHEIGSVARRFAATMASAQEAGAVWLDCVKRAGAGAQTQIHGVGDGAAWIIEQAEQRFGQQGSYLIDFYHVSAYLAAAGAVIAGQKAMDGPRSGACTCWATPTHVNSTRHCPDIDHRDHQTARGCTPRFDGHSAAAARRTARRNLASRLLPQGLRRRARFYLFLLAAALLRLPLALPLALASWPWSAAPVSSVTRNLRSVWL